MRYSINYVDKAIDYNDGNVNVEVIFENKEQVSQPHLKTHD